MNQAQEQRSFEIAARKVGQAMLTDDKIRMLEHGAKLCHLRSRLSTFMILLDDEIDRFGHSQGRAEALALILTADFCWQTLRTLAGRSGDDQAWIVAALPADWEQSDEDIGDDFYGRQRKIVDNAKWIFDLHSAMRHPSCERPDLIAILRDPVGSETGDQLLVAAREIRQVWLSVQARMTALPALPTTSPASRT